MPRASGDTPAPWGSGVHNSGDAPRKWGYTSPRTAQDGIGQGCPAQVGIHRPVHWAFLIGAGMPRASGDTPFVVT